MGRYLKPIQWRTPRYYQGIYSYIFSFAVSLGWLLVVCIVQWYGSVERKDDERDPDENEMLVLLKIHCVFRPESEESGSGRPGHGWLPPTSRVAE